MEIDEELKEKVREQVKKIDKEQVEKRKIMAETKREVSNLNIQKYSLLKGIGETFTWKRKGRKKKVEEKQPEVKDETRQGI